MSIPLIQKPDKDDINTSIIAIKRNIERINMLLGLVDNDSPDLSGFATKQELQDAVTELQPVDEVTVGNMQSVTSNAVSKAMSYSTTEHLTGKKWIDGKPIYERVIMCSTALTFTPNQWTSLVSYFSGITDIMAVIDTLINAKFEAAKDTNISSAFVSIINSSSAQARTAGDYTITATGGYISFEYTKTTD